MIRVDQPVVTLATINMRLTPGYMGKPGADVITVVHLWTVALVTAGPTQADGLTWWRIETDHGEGWVAEETSTAKPLLDIVDDTDWGKTIRFILSVEGGLSVDPTDSGNYTGGRVGVGQFRGTKYGLSGFAYPDLDFSTLTMWGAKPLYYQDYWIGSGADALTWPLCLTHCDFAVNAGPARARHTLNLSGPDWTRYNDLRESFYREAVGTQVQKMAWFGRLRDIKEYGRK